MPKSENEIVKQEEVFDYEVFDLADGRRVGVSADMSCGKPMLTVTELEPAMPKSEKTVEEILERIKERREELIRLSFEPECSDETKRWFGARMGELNALENWIQSDAKEGNDDDC